MGFFSALFGTGSSSKHLKDAKQLVHILHSFDSKGLAHARVMADVAFAYVIRSATEQRDLRSVRAMDALMNKLPLADSTIREIKEVEKYFDSQRFDLARSDDLVLVQVANGLPIWLLSWRGAYDAELKPHALEAWRVLANCDREEFAATTEKFLRIFEGTPVYEPYVEISQSGVPPRYMRVSSLMNA